MQTEFRRAELPREIRSLVRFDHLAFAEYPNDWFHADYWRNLDSWWLIVDGRKIGCCAFEPHVEFREDLGEPNRTRKGSLYIVSTAVLPRFRGFGFGTLMKSWQIAYARAHGFNRIITNTRKSNRAMVRLNKKFTFVVVRTSSNYYSGPSEPTVVMELRF